MAKLDIGSRIRDRRTELKLKQSDLAQRIGISASYLNLIEHNRRRIGGKILVKIAEALEVEPLQLTQGAELHLLEGLQAVLSKFESSGSEQEKLEDFATKFPEWAKIVTQLDAKLKATQHIIDGLNNRLTHDPAIAAAVHEVLSTAASIKSTATILTETPTLEPEWLERFHINIDQDSQRLAQSSRALAEQLESVDNALPEHVLAGQEVDHFVNSHKYSFPELEPRGTQEVDAVCAAANLSKAAGFQVRALLNQYQKDAEALPLGQLRSILSQAQEPDPLYITRTLGLEPSIVLRRLAALPELGAGLICADRGGHLTLRKDIPGFSFPSFGSACALWPVYDVLGTSGQLRFDRCALAGTLHHQFDCYAASQLSSPDTYNTAAPTTAVMLILPATTKPAAIRHIGSSCAFCPIDTCSVRRDLPVI